MIRLLPPLTVSDDELERGLDILEACSWPAEVALEGIRKTYGDVAAVDGVDLNVGAGEFFTLLGPSGSGKTTTLRMIAGFEQPDAGRVTLGGEDITRTPPSQARRQHRVPGLRALPAHDRRRERRATA